MDHETFGAQEWALPGYGGDPQRAHGLAVDQHTLLTSPGPEHGETEQPPKAPSSTSTPTRTGIRGTRGHCISRGGHRSTDIANHSSNRLFRDSLAKAKWRAGLEPGDSIKLPATFGTLKRELFRKVVPSVSGGDSQCIIRRHEVFDEIIERTGAYIKMPAHTDHVIQLWGEPAQIASAKHLLQQVISKCYRSLSKKKVEWTRISAHSVNREASTDWEEMHGHMLQQLREEPDTHSIFPEKLLFLWPQDGPSIEESLGEQLEALDAIRAKFGYFVFVPKDLPGYICVLGVDRDIMRHIVWRLRTKWGEAVASRNLKSKVYFVEPPRPDFMKREIIVERGSHNMKPLLHGDLLTGTELTRWPDQAELIRSKNNAWLLNTMERSLKGISLVRGHLRMRVNLGTFVLDSYRRPAGGKSSYSLEEFREMLLQEQTRGRLIPELKTSPENVLSRCFKSHNLLEHYETASGPLENAEPVFSATFEFLGKGNALLRFEAEYAKRRGAPEYEITERRWLRPRSGDQSIIDRPILQICVADFERCDWQIEINSMEFHKEQPIDAALRAFSHAIAFKCTTDISALTTKSKRMMIFPSTVPVSRFIEKAAIRYRLKGTQYILEIARYDEYKRAVTANLSERNPPTPEDMIFENPLTSWGVSLFSSNWDNLLGQHANLAAGLSTHYIPDLNTFFRSIESVSSRGPAEGFWQFIDLVKKVSELFGSDQAMLDIRSSGADTSSAPPGGAKDDITSKDSATFKPR